MTENKNWAVYIEGMALPWVDGVTKSAAEDYTRQFNSWGVHAAAQKVNTARPLKPE